MAEVTFTGNELREYEPEVAARLEAEIADGARDEEADQPLQCRITERRAERAQIGVQIEGKGWLVSFAVTTPTAVGEVRMETKRALRDRTKRKPNYRRATRR